MLKTSIRPSAKAVDEEFLALKEEGNFQDAVRLAQERVAESEKEFGREQRFSLERFLLDRSHALILDLARKRTDRE